MLSQFESTVKATITFLKLINVKVNNSTVSETLQNHPDWPGMLCISDSLNKWNIPNGAGKIEVDRIDELPRPFLAFTKNKVITVEIVIDINKNGVSLYSNDYKNPITQKRDDFIKYWKGVYLIAEPSSGSGEKNYKASKRKNIISNLRSVSAFLIITALTLLLLRSNIENSNLIITKFSAYLQYIILVLGVIVTSFLLWYEIDKNNPILKKICTGIAKGNCNAILTGDQSKVFRWLTWSELGFFYFMGGLLVLLSTTTNMISIIYLLAWLNILALPYTVFSIYYQWHVAKQWCLLCLAVQVLLVSGGLNSLANNLVSFYLQLSLLLLVKAVLCYLLPATIWYAIKPFLLKLQESKNTKREYLRIKFNSEIFYSLLKKQKSIIVSADGLGIDLGNLKATNTIIKVCNPYCGPCADAHPKLEKLMEEVHNLKTKIIFIAPDNVNNLAFKAVNHLLAIDAENNKARTTKALDDWYLADKKIYEAFAFKYPVNKDLISQFDRVSAMYKWCNAMEIQYTPTFFINGFQLPGNYDIEDLHYFLLE